MIHWDEGLSTQDFVPVPGLVQGCWDECFVMTLSTSLLVKLRSSVIEKPLRMRTLKTALNFYASTISKL